MPETTTLRTLSGMPSAPAGLADSTLVMIDCQNTYTQGVMALDGVSAALEEAAKLLERARSAGIPIVHIQHDSGVGRRTTSAPRSVRSSTRLPPRARRP